jgi:FixJ family two-component response regulator
MPDSPHPPRIVIVDDDDAVRVALCRLVRAAGLRVAAFASGADLLASPPETVSALVVDYHLPDQNGLQVISALGSAWKTRPPVLMITADGDPSLAERALAAGAFALLVKPVEASRLLAELFGALDGAFRSNGAAPTDRRDGQ